MNIEKKFDHKSINYLLICSNATLELIIISE